VGRTAIKGERPIKGLVGGGPAIAKGDLLCTRRPVRRGLLRREKGSCVRSSGGKDARRKTIRANETAARKEIIDQRLLGKEEKT